MYHNWETVILNLQKINDNVSIDDTVWLNIVDNLLKLKVKYFVIKNYDKQKKLLDYLKQKNINYIIVSNDNIKDKNVFCETTLLELNSFPEKFVGKNIIIKLRVIDLNINLKNVFLKTKFGKVIIDLENYCRTIYSSYWKNRKEVINKDNIFSVNDRRNMVRFSNNLLSNKEKWKIMNSREYLKSIPNYGITQNWKCKYINSFCINSDSSLFICEQKGFIIPISIFDCGEGSIEDKQMEQKLLKNMITTSQYCNGCFQVWKFDKDLMRNIYG